MVRPSVSGISAERGTREAPVAMAAPTVQSGGSAYWANTASTTGSSAAPGAVSIPASPNMSTNRWLTATSVLPSPWKTAASGRASMTA